MEFVCTVGTAEGGVVEETLKAHSDEAARQELERRGYHVFKVRRRGISLRFSLPGGRRARPIPLRSLMVFNQELASLLKAGLPMLQAIDLMYERQNEPMFKEVLGEVRRQIRDGKDLSFAVESFGSLFPPLYAPTLKAGEQSGELEGVIRRFVRYQKLVEGARRKLISALVYPAVLIGLSVLLIGVMTIYVVPKFSEFFADLGTELPLLTRITLGLSSFLSQHWLVVLLVLGLLVFGVYQWGRTEWGLLALSRWKLRLPLLGSVFQRLAISEFCRSLSTLLAGGIPAVPALENAVEAVGNAYVRKRLAPMIPRVREGAALHLTLEESGVSPEIAIEMAKVGEETGSLDEMMGNASDFLDEEVDTQMERLLTLVEPVMLVLMGLIVATLLVSVYLPLFSMLGQVRD
ncbi:MAG: type II secretion system F family protein [Acidobacteriota bacterium]|nr:type II secretion system F family protein [Acidobacteriota bacterium]